MLLELVTKFLDAIASQYSGLLVIRFKLSRYVNIRGLNVGMLVIRFKLSRYLNIRGFNIGLLVICFKL